MTRILELSKREDTEMPDDVVDLGTPDSATLQDRLTPNPTTYSKTYTNGTGGYDSTGYSKVSNMKGLVANVPTPDRRQSSSCCS